MHLKEKGTTLLLSGVIATSVVVGAVGGTMLSALNTQVIPARAKLRTIPGPARPIASPMITKTPVPMITPPRSPVAGVSPGSAACRRVVIARPRTSCPTVSLP